MVGFNLLALSVPIIVMNIGILIIKLKITDIFNDLLKILFTI